MKPAMIVGKTSEITVAAGRAGDAPALGTERQRHGLLGWRDDDFLAVELDELPLSVGEGRKRFVGCGTVWPRGGLGLRLRSRAWRRGFELRSFRGRGSLGQRSLGFGGFGFRR